MCTPERNQKRKRSSSDSSVSYVGPDGGLLQTHDSSESQSSPVPVLESTSPQRPESPVPVPAEFILRPESPHSKNVYTPPRDFSSSSVEEPCIRRSSPVKDSDAGPSQSLLETEDILTAQERFVSPHAEFHGILLEEGDREEELESNFDGEENYILDEENAPVYEGAPISLHESLVSILTLVLSFSLSGQCIKALLSLIMLHCLDKGNIFKKSLYLFKKYFSFIQGPLDYNYYCSVCFNECPQKVECSSCANKTPLCCLIRLPLITQLQTMLLRKKFVSNLLLRDEARSSDISDIYNGALYKECTKTASVGDLLQLSFMWATDGAALFKSSNTSVWPIFLTINELPYRQRFQRENILVPAIWCGPVKPYGNLLTNIMYPDLRSLSEGVQLKVSGKTQLVKGHVLCGTGDTPARSLMLNMVNFNGEHSCQKCLQKGESREGYPGVRVFPYRPEEMAARDATNFARHAFLAQSLTYGQHYMGVKGPTALTKISTDVIRGTAIDSMHLLYGGAGKTNLKFFLDSRFNYFKCNVSGTHKAVIDGRLLGIKPPFFLTRVPKSLKDLGIWNTSQHKSMFLYYALPVFKGVIPDMNLKHYASLIAATQLLNADIVSTDSLALAKALIHKYVSYFEDLYGREDMTLTFHLLLHLCDLVKDLGPLWVTSCFPLESLNGVVLNLVHGTRYAEMQIASSVQMCLGLPDLVTNLPDSKCKQFCEDLLSKTKKGVSFPIGNVTVVGHWEKPKNLASPIKESLKHFNLDESKLTVFHSLRKDRNLYVAESYTRCTTRDASAVLYHDGNTIQVGILIIFLRSAECNCQGCSCDCSLYAVLEKLETVGSFETLLPDVYVPNIHAYRRLKDYVVISPDILCGVGVKMIINNQLLIAKRCNQKEIE